jgi:hypothetical protein
MFEEELRHRKVFYNLVSCEKRDLAKEDYFSLADKDEEERKDDIQSLSCPNNKTTEETSIKSKGFWQKIKDAL